MSRLPTLAFCSDVDFADWGTYREVHRILGDEFGFETEDSFWLFDPSGSDLALFRGSLESKGPRHDELLEEIRSGRLAVLHGAGNFDRTQTRLRPCRSMIADGLAYLKEYATVPRVWTNHGDEGNIQNIGWPGASYQQGDDPSSSVYLLDLLMSYGVQFFWTDRLTTNSFVFRNPGGEGPALVRHEDNRAGLAMHGFFRYRGALRKAPDAQTLGLQLTEEHLRALVDGRGDTIIYQHWCVHRGPDLRPRTAGRPVFPPESEVALRRLSKMRDEKLLRVSRASCLLEEHVQASARA